MDGTITWEDFVDGCEGFLKLPCFSAWEFVKAMDIPGGKYLKVTTANMRNFKTGDPGSDARELITQETHILYSLSYSVPVLYFRMSRADGRMLKLEEVFRLQQVKPDTNSFFRREFMDQEEHPLLHTPFFVFHPCRTKDVLKYFPNNPTSNSNLNYLVSWLNIMSSVFVQLMDHWSHLGIAFPVTSKIGPFLT